MIIEIEGEPVPQGRMKYTSRGGFARAYDPKAKQKARIRELLKCKTALHYYEFPKISFIFFMPIPSGTSRRKLIEMEGERVKHIKRPDVDNLVKLYLDCMDGIVFEKDEHVSLGLCVKIYSAHPRTLISIRESSPVLQDWEFHQVVSSESCIPNALISDFQCESYNLLPQAPEQYGQMTFLDCKDQSSA